MHEAGRSARSPGIWSSTGARCAAICPVRSRSAGGAAPRGGICGQRLGSCRCTRAGSGSSPRPRSGRCRPRAPGVAAGGRRERGQGRLPLRHHGLAVRLRRCPISKPTAGGSGRAAPRRGGNPSSASARRQHPRRRLVDDLGERLPLTRQRPCIGFTSRADETQRRDGGWSSSRAWMRVLRASASSARSSSRVSTSSSSRAGRAGPVGAVGAAGSVAAGGCPARPGPRPRRAAHRCRPAQGAAAPAAGVGRRAVRCARSAARSARGPSLHLGRRSWSAPAWEGSPSGISVRSHAVRRTSFCEANRWARPAPATPTDTSPERARRGGQM